MVTPRWTTFAAVATPPPSRRAGAHRHRLNRQKPRNPSQIYREFNDAVDEVGGNAYAAYVVACRFADPEHAPLVGLVNSAALERAVGKWAEEFPHQRVSRGFDFDAYLADERAALEQ